jgi:hypothetical protein
MGKRYNLRKLNELEVKKQYLIQTTNSFAALGNSSNAEDINRAWVNIKGIKKLQLDSLMKNVYILYIVQWLQDPSQINVDKLNTVRREASRHLGTKK